MNDRRGRRRAVLVATSSYDDDRLPGLSAPAADARALADVLGDESLGGFEVEVLTDKPGWAVAERVEAVLTDSGPDDTVLLHFACHGLKDDGGGLYLAARNTHPRRLVSTAIDSAAVTRMMRASRAGGVILLLDCCFGGAFARGMLARAADDLDLTARLDGALSGGRGLAVLTASSAVEWAFEKDGDGHRGAPAASVFTQALVDGIASGEADRDRDGRVSLRELYDYVSERVHAQGARQTPAKWEFNVRGDLYIARSPWRTVTQGTLPESIRDLLRHSDPRVRVIGIGELAEAAAGPDLPIAAAARRTLADLATDDSRLVSSAAGDAITETNLRLSTDAVNLGVAPVGSGDAVAIDVGGVPLARMSAVHATTGVRAWLDGDRLLVRAAPAAPGQVSGTVTLRGPAGEARLTVSGWALPSPGPYLDEMSRFADMIVGAPRNEAIIRTLGAVVARWAGDSPRAAEELRRVPELLRVTGDPAHRAATAALYALAQHLAGDTDAARHWIGWARATLPPEPEPTGSPPLEDAAGQETGDSPGPADAGRPEFGLRFAACSNAGFRDAAVAGPRLLAVADGNVYAHGDLASAATIASLVGLNERAPEGDLSATLSDAMREANRRLSRMAGENRSPEDFGTTCTAMLVSGTGEAAVCHIGDSRAYLLRDGDLYQITADDPHALNGRTDLELDENRRSVMLGDRYLLCSNGLVQVLDPAAILETVSTNPSPADAARRLFELALRDGGPDNITCVVADLVDVAAEASFSPGAPIVVGAASRQAVSDSPTGPDEDTTLTAPSMQKEDEKPKTGDTRSARLAVDWVALLTGEPDPAQDVFDGVTEVLSQKFGQSGLELVLPALLATLAGHQDAAEELLTRLEAWDGDIGEGFLLVAAWICTLMPDHDRVLRLIYISDDLKLMIEALDVRGLIVDDEGEQITFPAYALGLMSVIGWLAGRAGETQLARKLITAAINNVPEDGESQSRVIIADLITGFAAAHLGLYDLVDPYLTRVAGPPDSGVAAVPRMLELTAAALVAVTAGDHRYSGLLEELHRVSESAPADGDRLIGRFLAAWASALRTPGGDQRVAAAAAALLQTESPVTSSDRDYLFIVRALTIVLGVWAGGSEQVRSLLPALESHPPVSADPYFFDTITTWLAAQAGDLERAVRLMERQAAMAPGYADDDPLDAAVAFLALAAISATVDHRPYPALLDIAGLIVPSGPQTNRTATLIAALSDLCRRLFPGGTGDA